MGILVKTIDMQGFDGSVVDRICVLPVAAQ